GFFGLGENAPVLGVEPTEQVHGTQKVRIAVRAKREGVEECGGELAEVGVAAGEEIEVVVVEGADDAVGLLDSVAKLGWGDPSVDRAPQVGVLNLGIKYHTADLAEELDLLISRAGHGEAEFLEVARSAV